MLTMLKQAPLWRIGWLLLAGVLCLNGLQMTLAEPGDIQTPYLAWQPDGEILAVASGDSVWLLDAASGEILNTITGLQEQTVEPSWSPDGNQLAIVNDYDVEIWDTPWDAQLAQRSVVYQFYARAAKSQPRPSIMSVAWSPDGSQIAQSFGSVIDIWNAADGTYQRTLTGNWNRTTDLIWTTDNRLVMGNVGGMAIVLNPDDGSLINYFLIMSGTEGIWSLDFSPDGSQLVMGLSGGYVMVWGDTHTEETMTHLSSLDLVGHTDFVPTVDWSPDGRFIATGSRDETVRIWDAVTGKELYQAKQDLSVQVNSVAWSPDGSQLAYGQPDGTVAFIPAPEMPK